MIIQTEIAEKVACVCCGAEKYSTQSPYLCHNCWKNGKAAQMIQRLTPRALDEATCTAKYHLALAEKGDTRCGVCGQPLRQ